MLRRLNYRLRERRYARWGYPVVTIGNEVSAKRALLAYISTGMTWDEQDPRLTGHQNIRQSRTIARLIANRGYLVDVVQYNDRRFVPHTAYDLIIAHPGAVSNHIQSMYRTGVRCVLRTGRHAAFVDQVAQERYTQLRLRRGESLRWASMTETDVVYKGFDAIACFDGNGSTSATFRHIGLPVYGFRNHANPAIQPVNRDEYPPRNAFVYMAAKHHILKGLDWLLEVFSSRPHCTLYVCGGVDNSLARLYRREFSLPNIKRMGFISLKSHSFRRLCTNAAWYISPSASDGFQGTALDVMAAGLVPLISPACGFDPGSAGIMMNPCTLDDVAKRVDHAVMCSQSDWLEMRNQALDQIKTLYSPASFEEDWSRILDQLHV